MTRVLLEQLVHLIIVLPIILFTLSNRKADTLKVLSVFFLYFIFHGLMLDLPTEYSGLRFTSGSWNWSGKIYAVFASVLFLIIYRKFSLKDYFLTFKQNSDFTKYGIITIIVIFALKALSNWLYLSPSDWSTESILFQATMPGLDEEVAFRGIMLGLLTKILKPTSRAILHPAIYITAILFGFGHALHLSDAYALTFNLSSFLFTAIFGLAWAWITLRSGSILLALISHNLGNVTSQLISMGK